MSKDVEKSVNAINQSKVTCRKLNFDNTKLHDPADQDSSRLSTEFYEEYYKAIKHLKVDKQGLKVSR